MREERGQIVGDVVVYETFELWGTIAGNVKVIDGGKLYMRGAIYGDLIVEQGGRVHVFGNITGNLIMEDKTKVIVSGVIGKNATNGGGRLFIEPLARVLGKVRTEGKGETKNQSRG
ncbi:hypothetical protein BH10PLA1_BH10PLA1_08840 [soil metagenome]